MPSNLWANYNVQVLVLLKSDVLFLSLTPFLFFVVVRYESLILLVLYVAYIILMFNNHRIEGFFRQRIVNFAATSSETSPLLDNKDNIHTPTSGYTSEMENIDSDGIAFMPHHLDTQKNWNTTPPSVW